MDFGQAYGIATRLGDTLAAACERLEVAGSVRRRKPEVKDIELVVIPRWTRRPRMDAQLGLGQAVTSERVNDLATLVQSLQAAGHLQVIKPGTPTSQREPWRLDPAGKYWRLYLPHRDINVDLFLTTPASWGLVYLIRTGAADFSQAMLARWKAVSGGGYSLHGQLWRPGWRSAEHHPEEADVFRLCQVAPVAPHDRIDARTVRLAANVFAERNAERPLPTPTGANE